MLLGENEWWSWLDNSKQVIQFFDSVEDDEFRNQEMKSFETCSFQESELFVKKCWESIIDKNIIIPIPLVHIFDTNGDFIEKKDVDTTTPENDNEIHFNVNGDEEGADDVTSMEEISSEYSYDRPHEEVSINTSLDIGKKETEKKILRSSIAKSIFKVCGMSPTLRQFDDHHISFKNDKSNSYSRKVCADLLPHFQTSVLKICSKARVAYDEWQKEFFIKHDREPEKHDIEKENMMKIYLQTVYGEKLLKQWKIKF